MLMKKRIAISSCGGEELEIMEWDCFGGRGKRFRGGGAGTGLGNGVLRKKEDRGQGKGVEEESMEPQRRASLSEKGRKDGTAGVALPAGSRGWGGNKEGKAVRHAGKGRQMSVMW